MPSTATANGAGLLHSVAALLLLALLVWAPLPLASNLPWAWDLLAVGVGLGLALWGWGQASGRAALAVAWQVKVAALCLLLVAAWAWAQGQAWLVGLLPGVAPHDVWALAADYGLGVTPLLVADSGALPDALLRLLAYGGAFWLGYALGQDGTRARRLWQFLLAVTALYAAYGLVVFFTGAEMILWEEKWAGRGSLTSTFVNRNNFATYANIGLLVGLGLIVESFLDARSKADAKRIAAELVEKLVARRSPLLLAVLLLLTAMLLTNSRAGMLTALLGIASMLMLIVLAANPTPKAKLGVAVAAVLLVSGALWAFGQVTLERLGDLPSELDLERGSRLAAYLLALDMIADRPWTGHGYGTFEQVFQLYRDERFAVVYDMAHNTYLEHAVELGIPATVLLYVGPVLLFSMCVRGVFARRRNQVFPLTAAAVTVTVSFHSLVDFSLQMPAVALTYAVVLGVGCAQSLSSARRRGEPALRRQGPEPTLSFSAPPRPAASPAS
ncbi:O-antigen ligase family protein [Geminicoccaceae bacterium 1502E]|nr:O-antigen ligase family protein [Geminicoccaceae bacterium 1502E]